MSQAVPRRPASQCPSHQRRTATGEPGLSSHGSWIPLREYRLSSALGRCPTAEHRSRAASNGPVSWCCIGAMPMVFGQLPPWCFYIPHERR